MPENAYKMPIKCLQNAEMRTSISTKCLVKCLRMQARVQEREWMGVHSRNVGRLNCLLKCLQISYNTKTNAKSNFHKMLKCLQNAMQACAQEPECVGLHPRDAGRPASLLWRCMPTKCLQDAYKMPSKCRYAYLNFHKMPSQMLTNAGARPRTRVRGVTSARCWATVLSLLALNAYKMPMKCQYNKEIPTWI